MSVPYSVNQGNFRTEIETFTNIPYVSGQGGVLIYSQKLQAVTAAGVVTAYSGNSSVVLDVSVLGVNLTTGTVGSQQPQPNGIKIFVQAVGGGAVVEYPTGTIAGPVILITYGN
ncbi:MAG: hypothetical protein QW046_02905 [Candidatus Micrarchaeaceae archaeon]